MANIVDTAGRAIALYDPNEGFDTGKAHARLPPVPEGMHALSADQYLYALKSMGGEIADGLAKALNAAPNAYAYGRISYMPDAAGNGLLVWPGLNPESLEKIARENYIVHTIVQARVGDMLRYSGLSNHPWRPGWKIELVDGRKQPTSIDLKGIREAERFILNCNTETGNSDTRKRDAKGFHPFANYLARTARDSLRFDGMATWTDMDSAGRVKSFMSLPSGQIRLANRDGYKGNPNVFAVLVDETNAPVMPFTRDELIWRVRNPRNDAAIYAYGYPELDMAARIILGFQNAVELNMSTFDKNAIPNGMLLLKGDYFSDRQLDLITRELQNFKKGISKAWGIPALNVPEDGDVEMLNFMDWKGEDVRYRDWMNMSAGLFCSIYNFPLRRLGYFMSGKAKDSEPLKDESIELAGDDDPGLPIFLMAFEEVLNEGLLWTRWPEFRFAFTAKSPKDDARQYEEAKLAQTFKERRAEVDRKSLEEEAEEDMKPLMRLMDHCPVDSNLASVYQTLAAQWLKIESGVEGGKDQESPGARTGEKVDPARSLAHGHAAGVRRDSRSEKDSAAGKGA